MRLGVSLSTIIWSYKMATSSKISFSSSFSSLSELSPSDLSLSESSTKAARSTDILKYSARWRISSAVLPPERRLKDSWFAGILGTPQKRKVRPLCYLYNIVYSVHQNAGGESCRVQVDVTYRIFCSIVEILKIQKFYKDFVQEFKSTNFPVRTRLIAKSPSPKYPPKSDNPRKFERTEIWGKFSSASDLHRRSPSAASKALVVV